MLWTITIDCCCVIIVTTEALYDVFLLYLTTNSVCTQMPTSGL